MQTAAIEQPLQLSKAEETITKGLEQFNKRKADLTALAIEASGLKIAGLDDKVNIKKVSETRKKLKAERISVEKDGKAMRDHLTVVSKNISAKERELIEIIEPIEKDLLAQEKWVEEEKERIRKEEEEKENARVQDRINTLSQYNYTIDYVLVKNMDDFHFNKTVEEAKAAFEKAEEERKEQERLRIEEEARIKAEKEAEEFRIKKEREELELQRKKQEEAQRLIDEQNKKIEYDRRIASEELKRQQQENQKKLDEEKAKIEAERLKIQDEKEALERQKKKEIDDKRRAEELEKERERIAEEERVKAIEQARLAEEKRKQEEEQKRLEEIARAERQPDKVKLIAFADKLKASVGFEVKSKEAKAILKSTIEMIEGARKFLIEKCESL